MKKRYLIFAFLSLVLVLLTLPWGGRGLTDFERELAEGIFGDSLDYDSITIEEGGILTWIYPGVTVGNSVAYPVGEYDETDVKDQALMLHELTHVWQYQQFGLGYMPRALYEEVFTHDPYMVHYDAEKTFVEYDIEEQGEIVEEYHLTGNPDFAPYIMEIQTY